MATFDQQLGDSKQFAFSVGSLSSDTFGVVALSGEEQISRNYWFDLELISENKDIQFDQVMQKPGNLEIRGSGAAPPKSMYHGMVTQFRQLQEIGPYALYQARLEPQVRSLQYYRMSEVYLDKTLGAIIDDVFRAGGLSSTDYELRLIGDAAARTCPYLCQYEESALNFLQWLLEAAGVYYYFEDDETAEKVVLLNAQISQSPAVRKLSYHPISGMDDDRTLADAVQKVSLKLSRLPRTVLVRNYDYRRASVDIRYEATVSETGSGRVALYGEPVGTVAEAQQVAEVRAQELGCRGKIYQGASTAVGLRPGIGAELEGHYRQAFNAKYLVTQVRHEGSQAGALLAGLRERQDLGRAESAVFYRNEFTALPWAVQFRPQRVTPKPQIAGTMSAFVDAEGSGKYAELDDQGRYKVQVPYDLTDKPAMRASAWLRLATPDAGPSEGMHFPLRKGTEVLLSYEAGDPNRPTIVGAAVNSQYSNVVTNKNETYDIAQSGGGNLLQLQDQEGNQHVLLKSSKDNSFIALGDSAGAEQVKTALAAGVGHGASRAGGITQYTERDHLIKARGGLSVEVGPNAVTRVAVAAGDLQLTTDQNVVQNVAGYAQLNVGSPAAAATPVQGDLQINTSHDVVINAAGDCTITCQNYTLNTQGQTKTHTGVQELQIGDEWKVVGEKKEFFEGVSEQFNTGLRTEIYLGLYNRVYPARFTLFGLWKWDTSLLTKNEWNWGKVDMIITNSTKMTPAPTLKNYLLSLKSHVSSVTTATTQMHQGLATIRTHVNNLRQSGAIVNTSAFSAFL